MTIVKDIDPRPPLDMIKRVYELITGGQWTSLELWSKGAYLVSWAIDFLSRKTEPDGPIFGESDPTEAEFCQYCAKLHDWAADGGTQVQSSAIGAWLVKAAIIAIINRILAELAKNGFPDWIADKFRELKEEIEGL